MRIDKLTTKFQEALGDAQSIAAGHDNAYIEPVHVLLAMLRQSDAAARSLLQRAGANVGALTTALDAAVKRLPQVKGGDGQIQVGRDHIPVHARVATEAVGRLRAQAPVKPLGAATRGTP